MNRSDRASQGDSGDLWERLLEGLERGDLQPGLDSLRAGRPIYVWDKDTPDDAVIKKYPDGRRELVRFDAAGEHVIGPLPPVEPYI